MRSVTVAFLGAAGLLLLPGRVFAQDATWTGVVSGDWQTDGNWNPAAQPMGTAIFGGSGQTTITFSNNDFFHPVSVGTIQLDAGAPAYTFRPGYLSLTGIGIVNNSAHAPTLAPFSALGFLNSSTAANANIVTTASAGTFNYVEFRNTSTADHATITQSGATYFYDTSKAGNATINTAVLFLSNGGFTYFLNSSTADTATLNNSNGARTLFINTSTAGNSTISNVGAFGGSVPTTTSFADSARAGNATIANTDGGRTEFYNSAAAGTAKFTNGGKDAVAGFYAAVTFQNSSTADSATIVNNEFGVTGFSDTSTAGNASIANNNGGVTSFLTASTAGNATITNNAGGQTVFSENSTAGNARLIANAGGAVSFSGTGPAGNNQVTAGSIEGAGLFFLISSNLTVGGNNASTEVSGTITGGGSLTKTGTGTLILSGDNSYTGGTTINSGTLWVGSGSTTGSIVGNIVNNGSLAFNRANELIYSGNVTGTGSVAMLGAGTLTLTGMSNIGGSLTIANYTPAPVGTLVIDGGSFTALGGATVSAGSLRIIKGAAFATSDLNLRSGMVVSGAGSTATVTGLTAIGFVGPAFLAIDGGGVMNSSGAASVGSLAGSSAVSVEGTGSAWNVTGALNVSHNGFGSPTTLTIASGGMVTATGGVTVGSGSALNLGFAGLAGAIQTPTILNNGVISANFTDSLALSADISGVGGLVKQGTGKLTLTGNNSYSGLTMVDAGSLIVNGSIAPSSMTTVNAGGLLGGNGAVGNTTINGGAFAPGNGTPGSSMTVTGSLAMQSGALYMVQINPTTSSFTNVTGAATLNSGATVQASFTAGTYVAKKYTILHTSAGVTGQFGDVVTNANLPSGFKTTLSYGANDVYLDLALAFIPPPGSGLSGNQQGVGNALIGFFNSAGGIPLVFGGLTAAGLTQISGETAAGSQQTTVGAMSQFLGMVLDPSIDGRSEATPPADATPYAESDANAYASSGGARTRSERDAYAAVYRKAPMAGTFAQRWSVWGAGFGGSQTTDGSAALGSNAMTSRIYGGAAGADYRFSPSTVAGFALAGGGTSFTVANGGTGRSDLFQAGAFLKHKVGPAYLAGALAYGWQDVTTERTVTVAGIDRLRAQFNANAFSGRAEGGYRFVAPWMGGVGITPYAAGQFTIFDLPAYAEQVLSGANTFALGYASKSITATRSELGVRADRSYAMERTILTLRGRAAWAHDFNPDRPVAATFQALPGTSFVVNGAAAARDAALTTASAEIGWTSGFSLAGTFEGEFSNVTRSYAGKGVATYRW